MNAPAPGKGQYVHTFSDPDKLVSVPMVCHFNHLPEDPAHDYFSEKLILDKAMVGDVDIYHLLDRWLIGQIQMEALAALQDSRVLED